MKRREEKKKECGAAGEKRMKRIVQITDRDISIITVMAYGVASLKMIMHLLARSYGIEVSTPALKRRLWLLCTSGYIDAGKYPRVLKHGHTTMYALKKKAYIFLLPWEYPWNA